MSRRRFLSEDEEHAMIEALRTGHGGGEMCAADVETVLDWGHRARVSGHLLDLVVERKIQITGFRRGEPIFVAIGQDERNSA